MLSVELLFLRDSFTARVASPPVETAPATISPMVEMQNGHIVHLSAGKAYPLSHIPMTGKAGRCYKASPRKSAPFLEEELSHGRIFGHRRLR
jgi:hypothetical protein